MSLEDKPIDVRRKIVFRITLGSAIFLILLMAIIYISGVNKDQIYKKDSTFLRFYTTILNNTQSFFSSKHDIIEK